LYCYVYGNIDLVISFKNKLEVLQLFQFQKVENTAIHNDKDIFKLFVLGKNSIVYFCVLNGRQLFILKTKNMMENQKVVAINRPRNHIFLSYSKGEPCWIADISNKEFEIVIF
jgi:hypothetical protein